MKRPSRNKGISEVGWTGCKRGAESKRGKKGPKKREKGNRAAGRGGSGPKGLRGAARVDVANFSKTSKGDIQVEIKSNSCQQTPFCSLFSSFFITQCAGRRAGLAACLSRCGATGPATARACRRPGSVSPVIAPRLDKAGSSGRVRPASAPRPPHLAWLITARRRAGSATLLTERPPLAIRGNFSRPYNDAD